MTTEAPRDLPSGSLVSRMIRGQHLHRMTAPLYVTLNQGSCVLHSLHTPDLIHYQSCKISQVLGLSYSDSVPVAKHKVYFKNSGDRANLG